MVDFLFLKASDPRLSDFTPQITELIDLEACKLGVANPSAYFAPNNEFMLAMEDRRVMAVAVVKRDDFADASFLGYSLMITRPEARRRGLLARMVMLYMLRALPGILLRTLLRPTRKVYVYGDIATPLVYAKILQLRTVTFYPDLMRGDSLKKQAKGAALRAQLVERCGIRDMWQRPGLVRDVDIATGVIQDIGGGAGGAGGPPGHTSVYTSGRPDSPQRLIDSNIDKTWRLRWSTYVPPNADLLVIVPINPILFVLRMGGNLRFAFQRGKRPLASQTALQA